MLLFLSILTFSTEYYYYESNSIEDGTLLICQNEYQYEYIDDEDVIQISENFEEFNLEYSEKEINYEEPIIEENNDVEPEPKENTRYTKQISFKYP